MKYVKFFSGNWSRSIFGIIGLLTFSIVLTSCLDPVSPSPDPGYLAVHLQAAANDNVITIAGITDTVSKQDHFNITISEGRAVRKDSAYANLFQSLAEYRPQDHDYNILKRDESENPIDFQIFKTELPPGKYNEISFAMTADLMQLITSEGQILKIPIELPPEETPLIKFTTDYEIKSNDTTFVNLTIYPFQSVSRYKDSFRFLRKLEVKSVKQP